MEAIENDVDNLTLVPDEEEHQTVEEKLKTEIRRLPQEIKHQVAQILENRNTFEELMLVLPKHLSAFLMEDFLTTDDYDRKYTIENVRSIQNASEHQKRRRLNGEILFDEWGTSGQQRPCLVHLLFALDKIELRRASNLLRDFIGMDEEYYPTATDSAQYNEDDTGSNMVLQVLRDLQNELTGIQEDFEQIQPPPEEFLTITNIPKFNFEQIKTATNNFNIAKYGGFKSDGRFIGKGGFGTVYLAIDLLEDTKFVAVKVMSVDKIDDLKYKHFIRELKIISEVEHPHILKLLGYSVDRKPCIVYEYASGGPLNILLDKAHKGVEVYDFKDRVKNLCEISNALDYLHNDKRLVHRDIKPENILLDGRVAKLCDFGLTKPVIKDNVTETRIAGTNFYMAPELQYNEVTPLADIYAFGLVVLVTLIDLKIYDKERAENERYLPDFVNKRISDPEKHDEFMTTTVGMSHNSKPRLKLIEFALICARSDKSLRPSSIKFMYEKLLERL